MTLISHLPDLSPDQLCESKSGTSWNSGTSTCECMQGLVFKNDKNTDEGCGKMSPLKSGISKSQVMVSKLSYG